MLSHRAVPTRMPREFIEKYLTAEAHHSMRARRAPAARRPHYPGILCKFFAAGGCMRGAACIFSHDAKRFACPEEKESGAGAPARGGFRPAPHAPRPGAAGRPKPPPSSPFA